MINWIKHDLCWHVVRPEVRVLLEVLAYAPVRATIDLVGFNYICLDFDSLEKAAAELTPVLEEMIE